MEESLGDTDERGANNEERQDEHRSGQSAALAAMALRAPQDDQGSGRHETGTDGYVTFTVQPTARFPLVRGGALVVFVRARKAGENLLAGVSTRRLVQASVGAPQ